MRMMSGSLKGICGIPFDPLVDGVLSFRALMLPKGKSMAIPDVHGCFAVDGSWTNQVALMVVHFVEKTRRLPELLCYFIDHGMANRDQSGISVASLKLPLLIRKSTYEADTKVAPMSDVSGFTPISIAQAPWSIHLEPALKKLEPFATLQLFKPSTMGTWIAKPVASRIEVLVQMATAALEVAIAAVNRQDPSQASRVRSAAVAKLDTVVAALREKASSYDAKLTSRVVKISDAALASTVWDMSPVRAAFAAEEQPRLLRSRLLPTLLPTVQAGGPAASSVPSPVPPPASREVGEGSAAAKPREGLVDDDSDDDSDDESSDEDEVPFAEMRLGKRARQPTSRFEAGAKSGPKKPATKMSSAKPVDGLNPRTNAPYKRGPYGKDAKPEAKKAKAAEAAEKATARKATKAARLLAAAPSALAAQKIATLESKVHTLEGTVATLTTANAMLTNQLEVQTRGEAMKIQNAVLQSQLRSSNKLVQQFIAGVQVGQGKSMSDSAGPSGMPPPMMTPMADLGSVPAFRLPTE
jgi:hypothetical protein